MPTDAPDADARTELLQLTVDVWHPDCWTLETTADSGVGLLGYGTTAPPGASTRVGYYTAFGDSRDAVETLVRAIRGSDRTVDAVRHAPGPDVAPVAQNVVVTTGPSGGMRSAFRSRGYLHLGPTRHRAGRERRFLLTRADRRSVRRELAELEDAFDAHLVLRSLRAAPSSGSPPAAVSPDDLSVRQREAFALARDRGYYEYPREVTATALADALGVSKSTFLEHLRKAERTLLAGVRLG